jgi:uncharacterized membrane protein
MSKTRLEAFSDGVIAILITILVLELKVPHGADFDALKHMWPIFCVYVLSFVFIGIYWNNHHHMLHATTHVNGKILWANLHMLFWMSLMPFGTAWMSDTHLAPLPTATYGAILLLAGIGYLVLEKTIMATAGNDKLKEAIGRSDVKGNISAVLYALAIGAAFYRTWISAAIYVTVALMWLVPDRRIERHIASKPY